ncbi:unnamed protein product [Albugo candida]|uniref:NADH-ubiquinone oxidoreductase ESSS subunit n=1 Tax=Albugo candida TaxID=65357 RepID=A0A024GQG9_9STRA|nr:unnamed protein product [Albugo candida]|eukprot:CCI48801.1 unnamed protein product [Albugo candida]
MLRRSAFNGTRYFSINHKMGHIAMPETAMITKDGTHIFERKGWEYSTYMAIFGAPILLYLGITNQPETDSRVFAREEAAIIRENRKKLVGQEAL